MNSLYELINEVTAFPELYIGKPSLERLYAYINGFLSANIDLDDHCLDGFTEFVSEKYRLQSDHNWSEIISFFAPNENTAFARFVQLFNEFTERD